MIPKVLIVEDEPLTSKGILRTLQKWNPHEYEYITVYNGQEAAALLQTDGYGRSGGGNRGRHRHGLIQCP